VCRIPDQNSADQSQIFCERVIVLTGTVQLAQHAGRIGACLGRCTTRVNKTQNRDVSGVRSRRFNDLPSEPSKAPSGRNFDDRQIVTARHRWVVIVVGVMAGISPAVANVLTTNKIENVEESSLSIQVFRSSP